MQRRNNGAIPVVNARSPWPYSHSNIILKLLRATRRHETRNPGTEKQTVVDLHVAGPDAAPRGRRRVAAECSFQGTIARNSAPYSADITRQIAPPSNIHQDRLTQLEAFANSRMIPM